MDMALAVVTVIDNITVKRAMIKIGMLSATCGIFEEEVKNFSPPKIEPIATINSMMGLIAVFRT